MKGKEFPTTAVAAAVAGNYDDPEAVKVVEYVNDKKIHNMRFQEDAMFDFVIAKTRLVSKHDDLNSIHTIYIPPFENGRLQKFNENQQSLWDQQMKLYEKKLGKKTYTLLPASEYTLDDTKQKKRPSRRITVSKRRPEL